MPPPDDRENTEIRNMADEEGGYPCLEVLSGPRGRGRYRLQKGQNAIGRSRENDIVLDDSSVSRRHAMVDVAENGATVADLGSRNGTKVGGQKIAQAVSLAHKSRIKVGVFLLRFLTGPAEEEADVGSEPEQAAPASEELSSPHIPDPNISNEEPVPAEMERGPEHLPAVGEEAQTPAEMLQHGQVMEVVPSGARKKKTKLILFGVLGLALIAALAYGVPKVLKIVKGKPAASGQGVKVGTGGKPGGKDEKVGQVGGVLPAEPESLPIKVNEMQPVFLDISSTPIPARIFFGEAPIGVTPLRTTTNLKYGKWYEARAEFQLPEVGEVVEEKTQFSPPQGATVMPLNFPGKIGIFKVAALPKDAQLYLEGYFEKDPYRAKPIKFAEIVFGKPIYVPFGRYILELRKNRQLGNSQTYLDEVVYRREFLINATQTTYTVDVGDDALKIFPVQLTSVPSGAKVFIDEKEVGVTPFNGTFPVGEHLLSLKHEGFFDFVQVIKMEIDMPYTAEIQLKTSAAGELVNKADALMKEARYAEALPVLVDAFSKNPSELETAQISYMVALCYLKQKSYKEAEDYFLKAMQNDTYKYAGRLGVATVIFERGDAMKALQLLVEVLVSADDPKVRADAGALFQRLSPLKSVMYVTSDPSGARVFVNSAEVEQRTPLILNDLGVGSYKILFRKEGYQDEEIKLNLGVSEFRPVVAKLKRQ